MEEENAAFSLRDFFYILFKSKISITLFILATTATVFIGLQFRPEVYEARAAVLVKMGRENVAVPNMPTGSQQVIASMGVRKEDINSEIEILSNRYIAEKVVNKLGLDFLFPESEPPKTLFKRIKYRVKEVVKKVKEVIMEILYAIDLKKKLPLKERVTMAVQGSLDAMQVSNADVIEIKFRWIHPLIAKIVLDTVIEFYMEHHLISHKTSGSREFFQKQAARIEQSLLASEDKLQKLKEAEGISSFKEQKLTLLGQLNNFTASRNDTQTELSASYERTVELSRQLDMLLGSITPGFERAYATAESELLLERVQLRSLNMKKIMSDKHVASYRKDLDRLNTFGTELKRLNRQIQIDEENYRLYRKQLEEAIIMETLDNERVVNVRVIDPATASYVPVKPRKLMIMGLAVLLSLIFGIAAAFISELVQHTINTVEDVNRYLNLPVLATVEEEKK